MEGAVAGAVPAEQRTGAALPSTERLRALRLLPIPGAAIVVGVALAALGIQQAAPQPALPLFGLDAPTSLWLLCWGSGQLCLGWRAFRGAACIAVLLLVQLFQRFADRDVAHGWDGGLRGGGVAILPARPAGAALGES